MGKSRPGGAPHRPATTNNQPSIFCDAHADAGSCARSDGVRGRRIPKCFLAGLKETDVCDDSSWSALSGSQREILVHHTEYCVIGSHPQADVKGVTCSAPPLTARAAPPTLPRFAFPRFPANSWMWGCYVEAQTGAVGECNGKIFASSSTKMVRLSMKPTASLLVRPASEDVQVH